MRKGLGLLLTGALMTVGATIIVSTIVSEKKARKHIDSLSQKIKNTENELQEFSVSFE